MRALLAFGFVSCLQLLHAVPRPLKASFPPRETVNFDFGWRFHLGDPAGMNVQCSDAEFPTNYSKVQCKGLKSVHAANVR